MNIKAKAHYQAAIELLELMSIASLTALIADAIWIIRDITVSGFTPCLGLVCALLWGSVVAMGIGVYKYHIKAVKKILHSMLEAKVKQTRVKNRVRGLR